MTFIEAAKKSLYVRRPISKHMGSSKNGWIDARWAFEHERRPGPLADYSSLGISLLTWEDLMADDWEAKDD